MNIHGISAGDDGNPSAHDGAIRGNSLHVRTYGGDALVSASQARLIWAAKRRKKRDKRTTEEYYVPSGGLEETIECALTNRVFDAIVTRNHYGSLVLNARHALFIDIDVDASAPADPQGSIWSEMF